MDMCQNLTYRIWVVNICFFETQDAHCQGDRVLTQSNIAMVGPTLDARGSLFTEEFMTQPDWVRSMFFH